MTPEIKTITIPAGISPLISQDIKQIGTCLHRIQLEHGHRTETFVVEIVTLDAMHGTMWEVRYPVSKRHRFINPRHVSSSERITLWKETIDHGNNNFPNENGQRIIFWVTDRTTVLKKGESTHSRDKVDKIAKVIDKNNC